LVFSIFEWKASRGTDAKRYQSLFELKIAVLGVGGFLGNALFRFFDKPGNEVMALGRRKPAVLSDEQFRTLDTNSDTFELLFDYHLIINCVGAGVQSNYQVAQDELYHVNLQFPIRLISYLQNTGFTGQLVTFGTYFEIGNDPIRQVYSEDQLLAAVNKVSNHYCASKRLLTRFVQSWKVNFCHFHLILPTIYGFGEPKHRLLPYLVSCAKNNQIPHMSDGTQIRQYLHVQNLCEIVLALNRLTERESRFLNLPAEFTCSVRQLAERVYTFFGLTLPASSFGLQATRDSLMPYLILSDVRYQRLRLPTPVDFLEKSLLLY
jgi:nucleoside-diphosphate-sugar epimerase